VEKKKQHGHDGKKVVVVLGSPRSGTSMISGLLSILGVDMGDVRLPDFENPTGYYEDVAFSQLIAELFTAADSRANGFNPPSPDLIRAQFPKFTDKARLLIEQRSANAKSDIWGWKVIGTAFILDLFLPYLDDPYVVVVLRNPLDIAQSMVNYARRKNYAKIGLLEALRLANKYYDSIFAFLDKNPELPRMFVSYEATVNNPRQQVKRLADFLDLKATHAQVRKAQSFVTPHISYRKRVYRLRTFTVRTVKYVFKCLRNPMKTPYFIATTIRARMKTGR